VRGGADRHLLQVVAWAAGAGHRVTVACGRREPGVEVPNGVRVAVVRGLASATASSARLARLGPLLDGPELVHVQNVMNPVALRAAVGTGRAIVTVQDHRFFCPGPGKTLPDGRPCTMSPDGEVCRDCLPDDDYRKRMLKLMVERGEALRGARLVVLSGYMARELEVVGLPDARVIPPAMEVCPAPSEAGDFFLLGGRLVPHKAPLDALRAWELAGRPLPLQVAGEGPLEESLEGAVRLGWLDGETLRRKLARARALLFPSFWQEPFGMLAVEALACGAPVIVAESGGTRDWSTDGCIRVPQGDVEAMAEAMVRLASDPGRAVTLGKKGRRMVEERFNPTVVWPALEDLYGKVGGSGR